MLPCAVATPPMRIFVTRNVLVADPWIWMTSVGVATGVKATPE
ncbi:hypothetical protein [Methylocystis silviterrae]|nr:hypothetical protein [Methylocystis silviterrae]